MMQAERLTLDEAQEAVRQSNEEFAQALNGFKENVEAGVDEVSKYVDAIKNPYVMAATVFTVGMFFGQFVRFSLKRKATQQTNLESKKFVGQE